MLVMPRRNFAAEQSSFFEDNEEKQVRTTEKHIRELKFGNLWHMSGVLNQRPGLSLEKLETDGVIDRKREEELHRRLGWLRDGRRTQNKPDHLIAWIKTFSTYYMDLALMRHRDNTLTPKQLAWTYFQKNGHRCDLWSTHKDARRIEEEWLKE